jgi:hypothetical protein
MIAAGLFVWRVMKFRGAPDPVPLPGWPGNVVSREEREKAAAAEAKSGKKKPDEKKPKLELNDDDTSDAETEDSDTKDADRQDSGGS